LSSFNGSSGEEHPVAAERVSRRDRRRRSRRWWPFGTLVVVAVLAVSLALPFGRHQWAESLVRQPSPYTTLAFASPATLPTTLVDGQKVIFVFTVGNQESRNLVYRYLVQSSPSQVRAFGGSFAGGSVAVSEGQSRSVRVAADPHCAGSPCRISVDLVNQDEAIDFNIQVTGIGSTKGPG
jgi:hypothetical protein